MNILYITEFFPTENNNITGGVEARGYYTIKELDKKNRFFILTTNISNQKKKTQKIFTQSEIIYCLKGHYQINRGLIQRFLFVITAFYHFFKRRTKIDLIESSGWIANIVALLIKKINPKPIIITYHEVWIDQWKKLYGKIGYIGYFLEKIILKQNWTKIIAVSNQTKSSLINEGVAANKIEVVYNGVNFSKQNLISINKYKSPTICVISRLIPYKRINDLIDSVSIIKQKIPNIQVKIIGSGSEYDSLNSKVNYLKLEDYVHFLGHLNSHEEIMNILDQSQIFCLPSEKEGFGIVTVEAASHGIPYVVSDIEINKEITENEKGGLFFKTRNIQSLAEKIILLFSDKKLYQQKVTECYQLAEKYQWSNLTKKIENIYLSYENLCNNR